MKARSERGTILLAAIILMALAAIVVASSLSSTGTNSQSVVASKERSQEYFKSEETLGLAANWFRAHSTSLAMMFSRTNFYLLFDRSSPSVGSNDASNVTIPTKIKLRNTNYAAILTNDSSLASNYFPATTDTLTGAAFNPVTAFASSTFGSQKVRVTLVDAIANDSTKDYGDPDTGAAQPDTDFYPVYRIDAMTDDDSGTHVSAYMTGSLVIDSGVGFYGRDYVEVRQDIDSYKSNIGPYNTSTNRFANVPVGSHGSLSLHQNEIIYGTMKTTGAIINTSPFGGEVCADFISGCPNAGTTCQGSSCTIPSLPTYSAWASYCPSNQGNVTINPSATLTVAGNAANQKCWNTVTIGNNKVLTLTTTTYPYFFKTLTIPNNGRINFAPSPAAGTINIYVEKFTGDNFNGNQVYNINNKPYQLRIHYLGTAALTMNGTADMNAFLVAPYAGVTVSGNFTYQGGIKATSLYMTGSGNIHYDESGDVQTISDTTYRIRNQEENYK